MVERFIRAPDLEQRDPDVAMRICMQGIQHNSFAVLIQRECQLAMALESDPEIHKCRRIRRIDAHDVRPKRNPCYAR